MGLSFENYKAHGIEYFHDRDFLSALQHFKKAIRANQHDYESLFYIGCVYQEQKKHSLAAKYYAKSLAIRPSYIPPMVNLSHIYRDQAAYHDALKILTKAYSHKKKDSDVIYNIGDVYYDLNDFRKALKWFSKALKEDPEKLQCYSAIGNCYRRMGFYSEAREYYNKAIDLSSDDIYPILGIIRIYFDTHQETIAIKELKKELTHRNRLIDRKLIAYVFWEYNYAKNALEILRSIHKKDKSDFNIVLDISRLYCQLDKLYLSNIYFNAIESSASVGKPQISSYYNDLGIYYLDNNDNNLAVRYFQKSIKENPYNEKAFLNIGIAYDILGENANAIQSYEKALELNPSNVNVLLVIADFHYREDNYTKASQILERIFKIDDSQYDALILKGKIYYLNGNLKMAKESYKKAYKINESNYDARCNLAELYIENEEFDKAQLVLESGKYNNSNSAEIVICRAKTYFGLGMSTQGKNLLFNLSKNDRRREVLLSIIDVFWGVEFYSDAIALYRILIKRKEVDNVDYYNLACLYALSNKNKLSLKYLSKAIMCNSENIEIAKNDDDFKSIRDTDEFRSVTGLYDKI